MIIPLSLKNADRCSLFLNDPTTNKLWARDANTGEEIHIDKTQGICGYAATHKCIVNVPDAQTDDRYVMCMSHICV